MYEKNKKQNKKPKTKDTHNLKLIYYVEWMQSALKEVMTDKWGFKQLCTTWMQLTVPMLPLTGNQECDVQYYKATTTSDSSSSLANTEHYQCCSDILSL